MSKKSNFKYIKEKKYYSYTRPRRNVQDINESIDNCKATIQTIRDHFEKSRSLDNVKNNVEHTIKKLETALNKIKTADESAIDESAKRAAMITDDMLKELKNIFTQPPRRESTLGPPKSLTPKEKMQHTKQLCEAYEDAVWEEFQPKYGLHPAGKAVAVATTVLVAATIGFALMVAVYLLSLLFFDHSSASAMLPMCFKPTADKLTIAGLSGLLGLVSSIPLTNFFEKRRVPGETMQKTLEVAKATKAFAKEMRDRKQEVANPVPRPLDGGPVYGGT